MRAAVYRWFAFTGRLLYVGCSIDPDRRWRDLQQTETWTHLAAWRTTEWHESLAEARAEERAAIKTEDPLFNLQGLKRGSSKLVWRTFDVPDGPALTCLRYEGRWYLGDEAIAELRANVRAAYSDRLAS